jgi:hypothetical protein
LVGSAAAPATDGGTDALVHRVSTALTGSSVLLPVVLIVTVALIAVCPRKRLDNEHVDQPAETQTTCSVVSISRPQRKAEKVGLQRGGRRAMLQDALGLFDQTFDLTELLRRAGVKVRDRASGKAASDYFASTATDGLVRLRDHLRENAFWNRCLYGECAQTGLRFLAMVMSSAVFLFLLALAIVPSSATTNLTRVFIALLASFVGYALLADVLSWRSAAGSIESLERRLDSIKQLSDNDLRNKALGELLAIFAEYTVATSKVPPIPDAEYQKHRDGLNALWRERESGLTAPLLGSRSQASRP